MWFKNITLLTLPADFDIGLTELEHALAAIPLRSPGPLEMETRGFVSPFARDDAAMTHGTDGATLFWCARQAFSALWESINGPGSWGANPLVWVISFRRVDK